MMPADAFFDWLSLKLWIMYYNSELTREQKQENKRLLKEWEQNRVRVLPRQNGKSTLYRLFHGR